MKLSPGNHFLELPPETASSNFILHYIEHALPLSPVTNERLRGNIISAIMKGILTVYIGLRVQSNGDEHLTAIMSVMKTGDAITENQIMVIYTFSALHNMTPELVREGMEFVKIKAATAGCRQIIAYTELESISKIADTLGGKLATTVVWEV